MTSLSFEKFTVLGSGAWGTALAIALHKAGRQVTLWGRNTETINLMQNQRCTTSLQDVVIPSEIKITTDLQDALTTADAILIVVPAQQIRDFSKQIKSALPRKIPVILCCKGIEKETGLLTFQVFQEEIPDQPFLLFSGPSFAIEVAQGLPTALTLASKDIELCKKITNSIGSASLRPYNSSDIVGVAIGGAVKNVIAIACGIAIGKGLGENARAALITRGLSEINRLAIACGAAPQTLQGLSGVGDLILTCTSVQSRNFSFGLMFGRGMRMADILAIRSGVTEGVATTSAVCDLGRKTGVDLPICSAVYDILYNNTDISHTISQLMSRPFTSE